MSVTEIDRGWKEIKEQLKLLGENPKVAIGIRGDKAKEKAVDADGKPTPFQLWQIGTVHEFGAPNAKIPARPHISATIDSNVNTYNALKRKLVEQILTPYSKIDVIKGLEILGEKVLSDIRKRIRAGLQPPWSNATRNERYNRAGGKIVAETPLIDTGQYINALSYEVEKKGLK